MNKALPIIEPPLWSTLCQAGIRYSVPSTSTGSTMKASVLFICLLQKARKNMLQCSRKVVVYSISTSLRCKYQHFQCVYVYYVYYVYVYYLQTCSAIRGLGVSQNLVIGLRNIFRTRHYVTQRLGEIRSKWSIPLFLNKSWGQHW